MDALNLIATLYKQELADSNEQKLLFKVQCEQYKQKIAELERAIKEKNEEIEKLQTHEVKEVVEIDNEG